jgi:4,5-dihydroxyphthalate decarboxylase
MADSIPTLRTLLGHYPGTDALHAGAIRSPLLRLDFADVKVPNRAFKQVVRELSFDVAELAIVTYLQARAYGKPLVMLPATVLGRLQHPYLAYDPSRGRLTPADLAGRRVGVRSHSVTTVAWLRGILAQDYGVDVARIRWLALEDGHVAEFKDPPQVERAPEGSDLVTLLRAGDIDAAILAEPPAPDSGLATLIADPEPAGTAWCRRHDAVPINHVVVVRQSLAEAQPALVREIYRLLHQARQAAPRAGIDMLPFGVAAMRSSLAQIVEYSFAQGLIPRRFSVDELFDENTRAL